MIWFSLLLRLTSRSTTLARRLPSQVLALLLGYVLFPALPCATAHQAGVATHYPLHITDALGRKLTIQGNPRRIVSLSPSNTESLFALGAGKYVVGVTSFCDFPMEARAIKKIGGFAASTISIETIVALKPDLVLAGDRTQEGVIKALEALGVSVISVKVQSFEELYAQLLQLGEVLNENAEAQERVAYMRQRVQTIVKRSAGIAKEKRLKVYWEVFDEPLMSCGPRSIIGQQITLAGGINIFEDLREEFPQISAEAVIARNPAVIMGPELMRARSLSIERLRSRPGWEKLEAVQTGRLIILPDEPVARPGPRLVEGLTLIAARLYPDIFGDLVP